MDYLLKYLSAEGRQASVDPLVDTLGIKSLIVSGAEFTRDNIAQVSALVAVSSVLFGDLVSVSGDFQNELAEVSSEIATVSGYFETRVDELEFDFDAYTYQNSLDLAFVSGQVSGNYGVTKFIAESLVTDISDAPLEERWSVSGGQTFVSVSGMVFAPENSIPDVEVYKNGVRMTQDRLGGQVEDFRKVSSSEIEFSYGLQNLDRVLFRLERPSANHIPSSFFREYISGRLGKSVPLTPPGRFQVGRDALWVFRNGVYLLKSSVLGNAVDRYEETSPRFVTTEQRLEISDVVEVVNFGPPEGGSYRFYQGGLTGTPIPVPAYSTGSSQLLAWRNGLLMNAAGIGNAIERYTETSPTVVTLDFGAAPADMFSFENLDSVIWREDLTGFSGSTIALSNTYSDPERIFVFRNGVLLYRSGVLGEPLDRFSTPSSTSIGLGAPAIASDVFAIIRFG
jgi:hypothetical protein